MSDESARLLNLLSASWPAEKWRDVSVVIAVSGGADSVALACTMADLKFRTGGAGNLTIAHFDHQLRPDSVADAEFVRSLADRIGVPFELGSAKAGAIVADRRGSIEAAARQARYSFLLQTAERLGARYVATAHTADDQIETVLFNVLRGTGLSGVAGIPRARLLSPAVTAIRPLLEARRTDVIEYLKLQGQGYRVDPTNASREFTRNRLRHELLPQLREQFQFDVDNSLLRLANIAGEAQQLIESVAEELLDRCLLPRESAADETVCLDIRPLANQDRHLVREMFVTLWRQRGWPLQVMGFEHWNSLAELAQRRDASQTVSSSLTLPSNAVANVVDDQMLIIKLPPALQHPQ
jgi:tRNA(Ile)-lysidine synthase